MIVSLFVLRLGPVFADNQPYVGAKGEDAMTKKEEESRCDVRCGWRSKETMCLLCI